MRVFQIGDQTALFCERTQRLSELNATASLLWREFALGADFAAIVARLGEVGIAGPAAPSLIKPQLHEWQRLGYLTPLAVIAALAGPASASMRLRIGAMSAELRFFGAADGAAAAAAFAKLKSQEGEGEADVRIAIVGRLDGEEETDFLFLGEAPMGAAPRRQTVPRLKALLTEHYCGCVGEGFLAHGALVSLAGKRVFLGGEPGAGKTTLTLALVGQGFAYGGDDIVHISADGRACAIPFAAAAKSGAWELIRDYVPGFDRLVIHEREDGKLVRYVAPAELDDLGPRRIDLFLLLNRKQGASAHFDPLTQLQALCALLESGYSKRGAISAHTLEKLAGALAAANCARFRYDDPAEAVTAIRSMLRA